MGITLTFESYEEMLAYAKKLTGGETKSPLSQIKEAITEVKVKADQKPSQDIVAQADPEIIAAEPETSSSYSLEDVRAKLTALTRSGKQKEVREILDQFGAKNVTALEEKDYAAVMEKAGAI